MKIEFTPMTCDLCNKDLHPLDAHMGYINGELMTVHIDCWNSELDKLPPNPKEGE